MVRKNGFVTKIPITFDFYGQQSQTKFSLVSWTFHMESRNYLVEEAKPIHNKSPFYKPFDLPVGLVRFKNNFNFLWFEYLKANIIAVFDS